jgi:hypothetical protein
MRAFFWTEGESVYAKARLAALISSWTSKHAGLNPVGQADDADVIVAMLTEAPVSYSESTRLLARDPRLSARVDDVFVWDTSDLPIGLWPGFYASLRKSRFDRTRHRSFCYLGSFNQFVDWKPPRVDESGLFFSFQGSLSSPVRGRLFDTRYNRSDIKIEKVDPIWGGEIFSQKFDDMKKRYVEVIFRSKFVLCPRGNGTSSFRLFETMQCGRVPVIIADSWVAPEGIDWASCSVRVREAEIAQIPLILENYLPKWLEMASCARRLWEENYSPDTIGSTLMNGIASIRKTRTLPERLYRVKWPFKRSAHLLRKNAVSAKVFIQKSISQRRA